MTGLEQNNLLFVYGSLMSGCERGAFLNRDHKVRFLGTATTRGSLYDLGEFVGLIDNQEGEPINGELYEVIDAETFFATLDVIEGYWPKEPERSLYVRKQIPVESADGVVHAYAYVFNQLVNGFAMIASGEYEKRGKK